MKTNSTLLFLLFFFLSVGSGLIAQDEIPKLSGDRLVYDFADMLSESEEQALNQKLIAYNDTTSNEFVVVTVPDLKGYDVGDFAQRLGEKNKIGKAGKDNGAVILVSRDDRKISIQVGYGLEPVITDGRAGFIIRNIIAPAFKQGKYYEGLDKATDAMMEMAAGEFKAEKYEDEMPWFVPFLIILIIFLLIYVASRKKNKYSTYSGKGRHSGSWPYWGGGFGGGGGFGRGSGGGGGFGGFGGGGFGGGGASGGW